MNTLFHYLGIISFIGIILIALYLLLVGIVELYHKLWYRTWIHQWYVTLEAWYMWRHKKTPFSEIKQWDSVAYLHKVYSTNPKFKGKMFLQFWIKLLADMLASPEYKVWKEDQLY